INKGIKVIQVKEIDDSKLIDTNLLMDHGGFYEEKHPLNSLLIDFANQENTSTPKLIKEGKRLYFIEKYEAKDRLYIFGAGPDVKPLVRNLKYLDFNVNVIDPREAYNNDDELTIVDNRYLLH